MPCPTDCRGGQCTGVIHTEPTATPAAVEAIFCVSLHIIVKKKNIPGQTSLGLAMLLWWVLHVAGEDVDIASVARALRQAQEQAHTLTTMVSTWCAYHAILTAPQGAMQGEQVQMNAMNEAWRAR